MNDPRKRRADLSDEDATQWLEEPGLPTSNIRSPNPPYEPTPQWQTPALIPSSPIEDTANPTADDETSIDKHWRRLAWVLGGCCSAMLLLLVTYWFAIRDNRDPALVSFERVAIFVYSEVTKEFATPKKEPMSPNLEWETILAKPPVYNVLKTNSLVSPYTATISVEFKITVTAFVPDINAFKKTKKIVITDQIMSKTVILETVEGTYAYQDREWVLKSLNHTMRGEQEKDEATSTILSDTEIAALETRASGGDKLTSWCRLAVLMSQAPGKVE